MPVPHHMTFHGGGGAILSVGLLRRLNFTEWRECVESMRWRQGDTCAWRRGPALHHVNKRCYGRTLQSHPADASALVARADVLPSSLCDAFASVCSCSATVTLLAADVRVDAAGSDSYVTKCIWRAGFGMTDTGYSYMSDKPLEHFVFDRWTFQVCSRY